MELILLRHTQSLDNEARIFSSPDTALSALGERQLEILLEKEYPVKRVYTSPYKRSFCLAEQIAKRHGLPLIVDERLREIDFGEFQGLSFQEIEARYPEHVEQWMNDPWSFVYPRGEDFHRVRSRARRFYYDLEESSLIVSHQALMVSLLAEILDYSYSDLSKIYLGSGARIELKSQPWRLHKLENLKE